MAGDFLSQDEVDALLKGVTGVPDDAPRKIARLKAKNAKLKAEVASLREQLTTAQQTSSGIPGDEFNAIQPIAKLREAIAEARQFGVVTVMGVSSTEQLEQVFSKEDAAAFRANLETKLIFRVPSPEDAESFAAQLPADAAESIRANMNNKISITRTKGDRVRIEVMLPPNVLEAVDAFAKQNGWSRSKTIALLISVHPGIKIVGKHETLKEVHPLQENRLVIGKMGEGMSAWNLFDEITLPRAAVAPTGEVTSEVAKLNQALAHMGATVRGISPGSRTDVTAEDVARQINKALGELFTAEGKLVGEEPALD